MILVCAVCGKVKNDRHGDPSDHRVSHGLCKECANDQRKKLGLPIKEDEQEVSSKINDEKTRS